MRSRKNAIVVVDGREERRRVRAPDREGVRRKRKGGTLRGKRSMKNAIVVDFPWPLESAHRLCDAIARPKRSHVLSLLYCVLAAVVDQHLVIRLHSQGMVLSVVL